ncbi:MFS transporter [Marinithermus hydrothermalis]|uniref:Major facilitator superfamily MFS_1 n=1 Tax=Marinithermus hydrothermalis (strain DSM 14884 / JCM 11576 / T1) TaxID=869210 RepID=F2NRA3_MARHT|nr:MFS transporter [Marinithermus hydrothermalis]AEB12952.1 major facilitator superfamily MFS_1 [Marinithermus hydrothermalis DSM 14884]
MRWALVASGVVIFAALYAPQPLLPGLERAFAVPPGAAGWGMAGPLVALVLFSPLVPRLRLSAGWVLGGGVFGVGVFGVLGAVAPSLGAWVLLRFLQGACLAAVPGLAFALVVRLFPERARVMAGLLVAGNAVGGTLGRVLAGVLAEGLGERWALALVSLPALFLAPFFLVGKERVALEPPRYTPAAWPLLAIGTSLLFVNLFVANLLPYRLEALGFSQGRIGLVYLAYLAGILGSSAAGVFAERVGEARALYAALGVVLVGLGGMLAQGGVGVFAGFALVLFGVFAAQGVAGGLAGRWGSGVSGAYVSAYYLGGALAGGVYPPFVGLDFAASVGVAALVVGLALLSVPRAAPSAGARCN